MKHLSRSTASKNTLRIAITTGDVDGIGLEVTIKALNAIGPKPNVQFVVYRSSRVSTRGPKFSRKFTNKSLLEVLSPNPPARWVEEAAHACMSGEMHALVTAPLSKTSIVDSGLKDIGHTEILQRISGHTDLFMGFIGKKFNVLLATGHAPLSVALGQLNLDRLNKALNAAKTLKQALPAALQKRPIALVGVNPHAGEGGLIGSDEGWMRGLVESRLTQGEKIVGPLVPDAAFLEKNWPLHSVYVCPYHDQGLIPFKLVHGFRSGVHLTLGLPFVRTSVDHGTAKELFGKNKAEAGSMKDAILTAIRLCKESLQ